MESLRVIGLPEFLQAAKRGGGLSTPPLIHSTPSKNVMDILAGGHLKAVPCNVYKEPLCYLFVARPAYKWSSEDQPSRWQLPFVLVLKTLDHTLIKRIHPFDTGAFASGRLPDYIMTFDRDGYELGRNTDSIAALIDVFFGGVDAYRRGNAVPEADMRARHALGVEHQEVEALTRLYAQRTNSPSDDRARTIEVQAAVDVPLSPGNLLGVVIPKAYMAHGGIREALAVLRCRVETYDEFPISTESYYGVIYERVAAILDES